MQSPRNTACRSACAIFKLLVRSMSDIAAASGRTFALTVNIFEPLSELTVNVLILLPPAGTPANCIVAEISPCSFGASFQGCEGNFATVQPHEVCTPLIMTSPEEIFVRLKLKCASPVPLGTFVSCTSMLRARYSVTPVCG